MEVQQPVSTPVTMRPPVNKISKRFYLGSYIGCVAAELILGVIIFITVFTAAIASSAFSGDFSGDIGGLTGPLVAALGTVVIAVILLVFVSIYFMVVKSMLVYKAWQAIGDSHQHVTPGKAVGFLYIPFFNYYWWFPAISGFAKDYNAYLLRYNINSKKLSESLFLTVAILNVAAVVFSVAGTVNLVLEGILVSNTCDAINNIAQ